jgi:hypothetical protein|tara:strand:+ start:470 stop:895 length:426 start_codon:yes stop_codon:yes gene_type:complete
MSLVGGGGSPNVAGANPAGVGTSLNYVGNRVYAYSGQLDDVSSYTTGLKFSTGSETIHGMLQFDSMIQISNIASGDVAVFKVLINSEAISISKLDGGQEDMPATIELPVIIPPYTNVDIQYKGSADSTDFATFLRFTGKVM